MEEHCGERRGAHRVRKALLIGLLPYRCRGNEGSAEDEEEKNRRKDLTVLPSKHWTNCALRDRWATRRLRGASTVPPQDPATTVRFTAWLAAPSSLGVATRATSRGLPQGAFAKVTCESGQRCLLNRLVQRAASWRGRWVSRGKGAELSYRFIPGH